MLIFKRGRLTSESKRTQTYMSLCHANFIIKNFERKLKSDVEKLEEQER